VHDALARGDREARHCALVRLGLATVASDGGDVGVAPAGGVERGFGFGFRDQR